MWLPLEIMRSLELPGTEEGPEHGFVRRWGEEAPLTIDVPGGPPLNSTLIDAFAINPGGAIVRLYIDAAGNLHGYVAHPNGDE